MSVVQSRRPGWPEVLAFHAADTGTGPRVIAQLRACEVSALAFCRLLERWARGDADPCTPGKREAAFRLAPGKAGGGVPPRRRASRDRARGPRGAARALSAGAGAGRGGRRVLVRRA